MDALNPYEPPSTTAKVAVSVGNQTSAITVYIKDMQTVVAVNNKGEELYTFFRPIAFAEDFISILAFLVATAFTFLVLAIIAFLIYHTPEFPPALSVIAIAAFITLPIPAGLFAFYLISPRFSFSAVAAKRPSTRLISVRQHSLERSGSFRATSDRQMTIAKIICRNSTYSALSKWSPQSYTFYLSPRPENGLSLWSQSATDANPQEILHATKLNRQILIHSPLPVAISEEEKMLILSLFVLTLISDVKPRMFVR